jgi:radical SAM superfamily enzyme YgiQ (UPF0313 family)
MIGRRNKIVLYYPQFADERLGLPSGKDLLPLPLLTIAAWPKADGYEVVLIDGNLYSKDEAHRRVLEACEGALIYGTSGILGYQVADGFECSQKVKARHPGITSIIGGWFASTMPEMQLATGLYDAVAFGQGEITFREFVKAVDAGEPLENVAGLGLWRDNQLVRTAHRTVVGWNELLNCPWDLIDFDVYREQQMQQRAYRVVERLPRPPNIPAPKPYVGIAYYSSFGCPEPCTFCCSPGFTGLRWKSMPAQRMLDDIEELSQRWKFDIVRFHDANWGVMEKRSLEFAEGKLARGLDFQYLPMWQAFSIKRYKPTTLDLMAQAGMYIAIIGGEAGTDEMMRKIGKHTFGDDNFDAAMEMSKRGVDVWLTYIIGYPNETEESMLGTLDQARRVRAFVPGAHPAVWPYRPIPGTPMYQEALDLGYRPPQSLHGWGTIGEYHLDETWPDKIPAEILRKREIFQHYATLSHGLARGHVGWWEKRALARLQRNDFRFARVEAKAFDLYNRVSRKLAGRKLDTEETWESGDGAYVERGMTPRRKWAVRAVGSPR